jgi:hypothetical protein
VLCTRKEGTVIRHAITFYTPDYDGAPRGFGCATFGMAGVWGPKGNQSRRFPVEPEGLYFCGTYTQVLEEIRAAQISEPKAAIVLFGEVCDLSKQAESGNLMLSKLRFRNYGERHGTV